MNIEIAKILKADIFSAVFSKSSFDLRRMGFAGEMYAINPKFKRGIRGFIMLKLAFLLRMKPLRKYNTVIFSNEATPARIWVKRSAKRIYYAHSISRHLFDQKEVYVQKISCCFRPFFKLALIPLKWWYIADLRSMNLLIANSQKNADFLKSIAPKVPVTVLYPPVNMKEFYPLLDSQMSAIHDEYFLSFARLTHAKRIHLLIQAFLKMPEKKLKIIYGKNDPQLQEFVELTGGQFEGEYWKSGVENIEFITLEDNSKLPDIIRHAKAVFCVSKNEDFGMNAIESFAS